MLNDTRTEADSEPREVAADAGAEPPDTDLATAKGPTADSNDWTVAAAAHASVVLTLLSAFAGGVGALIGLVVPLVIYLSYRERSRLVRFQALQALVYQGAGVLVYLVTAIALALVVTVIWIIAGLLSVVAVGFLLMPAALLITALMVIVLLVAPLAWVAYGLYAAYQVYQGGAFRYWLLGEWLEGEVRG